MEKPQNLHRCTTNIVSLMKRLQPRGVLRRDDVWGQVYPETCHLRHSWGT